MQQGKFILRNRLWFIIVPFAFLLVAIGLLTKIEINSDLNSYFPATMQSKINLQVIEESFGKKEPILLIFKTDDVLKTETLERIKAISHAFNRMQIVDEVFSLFDTKEIKGDDGFMLVHPIVEQIPSNDIDREILRENIKNNELAYKTLVSDDFNYTMIILNSSGKADDEALVNGIKQVIKEHPGEEQVYMNGMPYLRVESNHKISRDLFILLPLGLLIMIIFLYFSFREARGVWLPFLVVVFSIVISMALIPIMGWNLSLIGIIIPIMMIAIANDYGVHLISHYQELNAIQPEMSMRLIVLKTLKQLRMPIILTGLTTIVGIQGLLAHLMIPARQMGIIAALGIGVALLLSLTFIPSVLSTMKKGSVHPNFGQHQGITGKAISKMSTMVIAHPKRIISGFMLFLIVCSAGLVFFKPASDNDKVLPKKHSYNQTISIANQHFGGTRFLSLLFEGDMKDPELLNRMNNYEKTLKKMPEIGNVSSIATVLRIMSKAMNDEGTPFYNTIPPTHDAVAQYFELYNMSGEPDDFENLVDFNYTKGLMNIQFQASDMKELKRVIGAIESLTASDPNFKVMAGYSLTDKEMSEAISKGQVNSLLLALGAIFVLLLFIFRNWGAALIGSIPLAFAVICTFGIMGYLGIELNIVTALLSSISIGVGVDYTIHLFWRLKTETGLGKTLPEAINTTLTTTGRGIIINAFSVIVGFSVLFFSAFPFLKMFALLITLSIFLCLICAMLLMPALCLLIKPSFLNTKKRIS